MVKLILFDDKGETTNERMCGDMYVFFYRGVVINLYRSIYIVFTFDEP